VLVQDVKGERDVFRNRRRQTGLEELNRRLRICAIDLVSDIEQYQRTRTVWAIAKGERGIPRPLWGTPRLPQTKNIVSYQD
jgi:hypothetical protein